MSIGQAFKKRNLAPLRLMRCPVESNYSDSINAQAGITGDVAHPRACQTNPNTVTFGQVPGQSLLIILSRY